MERKKALKLSLDSKFPFKKFNMYIYSEQYRFNSTIPFISISLETPGEYSHIEDEESWKYDYRRSNFLLKKAIEQLKKDECLIFKHTEFDVYKSFGVYPPGVYPFTIVYNPQKNLLSYTASSNKIQTEFITYIPKDIMLESIEKLLSELNKLKVIKTIRKIMRSLESS